MLEGITRTKEDYRAAIRMRAGGREIRNNCAEPRPVQALFEGADLWLPRVNRDWAGQPAGPVMSAMPPQATAGRQNVARREGPGAVVASMRCENYIRLNLA